MQKIICKKWKESLVSKYEAAEELRAQDEFCDITLESMDKVKVKAHKIILITGSNYFRGLFSSGMRESSSECIEYKQIKGEVLQKVISFIYTGQLAVDTIEKIEEIAVCANYFQLNDLIEECANLLSGVISDDTCLKYWRLAHECFHKKFEEQCISHVVSSSSLLFENATFFKELDKDEVEVLLKDTRINWSEEMKFENILQWSKTNTKSKEEFSVDFSRFLEYIDFSSLSEKFILSNVLIDDDLAEQKDVRKKIAESFQHVETHRRKEESRSLPNSIKPNKNLVAIIGDKLKIISNDGNVSTSITKENNLWNIECAILKDSLFICGGRDKLEENQTGATICEIFDPAKKEWCKFPSMQTSRFWHACTFLEDRIYVCGGRSSNVTLSNVEIFDVDQEKWIQGPKMESGRSSFGLVSANRCLYAIGGFNTKNIEMLDPRTWDGWVKLHDGFEKGDLTQCISVNNDIYCFRRDKNPTIFDLRMKTMRSWNGGTNYITKKSGELFKVCILDRHFYFIENNYDNSNFIDFYKFDIEGNLICSKPKNFQMNCYSSIGILAALNCE